jgi:hypothetical protein
MKKKLLSAILLILIVCIQGCVIVVDGDQWPQKSQQNNIVSDETITEIDAIGKLAFDNSRREGFKRVAQRENISPEAQVHLIRATFKKLSFENSKKEILLTLINNPNFCSAAEIEILESLDKLAFNNSKEEILKAIDNVRTTDENQI